MQSGADDAIGKGTDPLNRLKGQKLNPGTRIAYTIDLTRQYHKLLQKEEEGRP